MSDSSKFKAWAVMKRSVNNLDGDRSYLAGRYYGNPTPEFEGCEKLLFTTRKAARDFIEEKFGYIRERQDLRCEPHGWRVPKPVRVCVSIALAP